MSIVLLYYDRISNNFLYLHEQMLRVSPYLYWRKRRLRPGNRPAITSFLHANDSSTCRVRFTKLSIVH